MHYTTLSPEQALATVQTALDFMGIKAVKPFSTTRFDDSVAISLLILVESTFPVEDFAASFCEDIQVLSLGAEEIYGHLILRATLLVRAVQ
ncbi:MAG: hypothetical protein IT322_21235 [Anaerolineae bacterium]|nr:hypothetical protein [Anaerolineae bacterium]